MGCARSWLLHGGVTYITRHWCFCYLLGPFLNCVAEASCQMLKSVKVEMLLLSAIHLHGHQHPGHIVQPVCGRIEVTQREEARRLMEHSRMPRLLVSVRDGATVHASMARLVSGAHAGRGKSGGTMHCQYSVAWL